MATEMKSRATPFSLHAIPVVADVHGDLHALKRVLAEIEALELTRPPLLLGDLFWSLEGGCEPEGVLDLVMSRQWLALVRGNTDEWLVDGTLESMCPSDPTEQAARDRMRRFMRRLGFKEREFLETLPLTYRFELHGRTWLAAHASPTSAMKGLPLGLPTEIVQQRMAGLEIDCLVTGHLHRAFTQMLGGILHVGVGAVGRHPFDYDGIADFVVLDATPSGIAVTHQRVRTQRKTVDHAAAMQVPA
jgi:predicted phosphodiesterase